MISFLEFSVLFVFTLVLSNIHNGHIFLPPVDPYHSFLIRLKVLLRTVFYTSLNFLQCFYTLIFQFIFPLAKCNKVYSRWESLPWACSLALLLLRGQSSCRYTVQICWFKVCSRLGVYAPAPLPTPEFIIWNLTHSVMVFGCEACGRWLGQVSALRNDESGPRELPCRFCHVLFEWKCGCLWPWQWALCWCLDLELPSLIMQYISLCKLSGLRYVVRVVQTLNKIGF